MPWYQFNPSGSLPYDTGNTAFYDAPQTLPPSCPTPNNFLCAIQANDIGGQPDITRALALEMATAINSHLESTNVKLRPLATV
nr:hypothetical protein [uncultured Sphingobacterium sp.]